MAHIEQSRLQFSSLNLLRLSRSLPTLSQLFYFLLRRSWAVNERKSSVMLISQGLKCCDTANLLEPSDAGNEVDEVRRKGREIGGGATLQEGRGRGSERI